MVVGVISDTHGLLRPQAVEALGGSALIVHAGDVGRPDVLEELAKIAPVHAVRGNVDGGWAAHLPERLVVEAGEARLYVLHDLHQLGTGPAAHGCQAVITGHSHRAARAFLRGVLHLNPGSAGPRRFQLPVTLALLRVEGRDLEAEIVTLAV